MATDTLTVTFSLTADFQTLQTVRHALAAADRQARLSSLLSETLVDGLADRRPLELTVYCTLRVPRPRSQPARTGLPLPCCQAGVLTWYDPDAQRTNLIGPLGSPDFLAALHGQAIVSFRYESATGATCTVYRRADGKWYAAKRLNGQLKRRYLGRPENISVARLEPLVRELAGEFTPE
jgi:hypothetical protein